MTTIESTQSILRIFIFYTPAIFNSPSRLLFFIFYSLLFSYFTPLPSYLSFFISYDKSRPRSGSTCVIYMIGNYLFMNKKHFRKFWGNFHTFFTLFHNTFGYTKKFDFSRQNMRVYNVL